MKTNSLWHEVTEEEKQQIKQDSKKLLNEFAAKLSKIKAPEGHHENQSGTREESDGWQTDEEFRNTTLANAPFVEDNTIVAEKGAWKK
jgi:arginine deiminase